MIIQNEQQRAKIRRTDEPLSNIATVYSVESGGIRLILAGETEAGPKLYPYNKSASFRAGQRVHLCREGGSVVVEYAIGGGVNLSDNPDDPDDPAPDPGGGGGSDADIEALKKDIETAKSTASAANDAANAAKTAAAAAQKTADSKLAGDTKYAGSGSAGGAATSADKLNTNAGSATQPVYFSGGKPVAGTAMGTMAYKNANDYVAKAGDTMTGQLTAQSLKSNSTGSGEKFIASGIESGKYADFVARTNSNRIGLVRFSDGSSSRQVTITPMLVNSDSWSDASIVLSSGAASGNGVVNINAPNVRIRGANIESWTSPALSSNPTVSGVTKTRFNHWLNSAIKLCTISGLINTTTAGVLSGLTTLWTLPSGCRPSFNVDFAVSGTNGTGRGLVTTAGAVQIALQSNAPKGNYAFSVTFPVG